MKKTFSESRMCFSFQRMCFSFQFVKGVVYPLLSGALITLLLFNANARAISGGKNNHFGPPGGNTGPLKVVNSADLLNHEASTFKQPADSWIFDKSVGNVDFYHKISNCQGQNVVFLKFENNNKHNVKISWKEVFVTQQEEAKKEGFKSEKKLTLIPGQTEASGCEDTINKACIILPEQAFPTHKVAILQFEFKDITVNTSNNT